jgi:hypothetical protein
MIDKREFLIKELQKAKDIHATENYNALSYWLRQRSATNVFTLYEK